ncbi:MAG TPA: cardiolipin synthase ClsB [Burkholderiales bacterium]
METRDGNRLTLLANGGAYFPALIAAFDAARREIFLESYLFADDASGGAVAAALGRAASRGVAVHLLIDGFGARDLPDALRERLLRAGVEVLVFRPLRGWWPFARGRLRRMHRKLACVDSQVAFVGGINVIDDFDAPGQVPRHDYAVRIEGPVTTQVRSAAAALWSRVFRSRTRRRWTDPGAAPAAPAGRQRAALVVRDNLRHRDDIEKAYLDCIESAREEVVIACAYFFPGRRFRRALIEASARGVRVVLLLQGRVEYLLLHYASRALYGSLLEAGIEIHEYHLGFLHAKVAVFDGRQASVGSSNIDPFSLLLAQEANVFVDDARFAEQLRDGLHAAMRDGARLVPPQAWSRRPRLQRLRIWLGYGLARFGLAFYGFERWH